MVTDIFFAAATLHGTAALRQLRRPSASSRQPVGSLTQCCAGSPVRFRRRLPEFTSTVPCALCQTSPTTAAPARVRSRCHHVDSNFGDELLASVASHQVPPAGHRRLRCAVPLLHPDARLYRLWTRQEEEEALLPDLRASLVLFFPLATRFLPSLSSSVVRCSSAPPASPTVSPKIEQRFVRRMERRVQSSPLGCRILKMHLLLVFARSPSRKKRNQSQPALNGNMPRKVSPKIEQRFVQRTARRVQSLPSGPYSQQAAGTPARNAFSCSQRSTAICRGNACRSSQTTSPCFARMPS